METKYRIVNAPSPFALEQGARIGSNMAIVHSVGPCSHLQWNPDPVNGRFMDEFPVYFEDYPKIAELRHAADAVWLEPLRQEIRALCRRSLGLGMQPVFHFYEPQLPLVFEREYPDIVGIWPRETQMGTVDVHTRMDPDNPETWKLMQSKYREISRDFPEVGMFIITTGDIAGCYWGLPEAKMARVDRLVRQAVSAQQGLDEAGHGAKVCFRLWWRNHPEGFYRDAARMIGEATGLPNALDLMNPVMKPYNAPSKTLSELFAKLPAGMPIMYKSTRMDIHDDAPLTLGAGAYPADREQIIEISYEQYHRKPWPLCKAAHIRLGLDAVKKHKLNGYVSLPINMGNNFRHEDPESGNLGRMNTWLFEKLAQGDKRDDRELVKAWLELEFEEPAPEAAVDALLEMNELTDKGLQWGGGIYARNPFSSPHTTKLTWFSEGHIYEDWPEKMMKPDKDFIEGLISMKNEACDRAAQHLCNIRAAEAGMHPELYCELEKRYEMFVQVIRLMRDWSGYLLMQYAVEKGVYPPERKVLGRMSRYVETFIRDLLRLHDTESGQYVRARISFPDQFPLS